MYKAEYPGIDVSQVPKAKSFKQVTAYEKPTEKFEVETVSMVNLVDLENLFHSSFSVFFFSNLARVQTDRFVFGAGLESYKDRGQDKDTNRTDGLQVHESRSVPAIQGASHRAGG